jgi:aminoglycoside phosphotransferase (APT) family kinase protein
MWGDRDQQAAVANPMPTQAEGFMTRQQAAERYAERSGRDPEAIPYYVVFGAFKMAVVLQQIYVRFHRGQTQDKRFAALGEVAAGLFQLAAERRP